MPKRPMLPSIGSSRCWHARQSGFCALSLTGLLWLRALGLYSGNGSAALVVGGALLVGANSMPSSTNYRPYTYRSVMVSH